MTDLEGLNQSYPPAVLMAAPRAASRMRARIPATPTGGGPAAAAPTGAGDQAPSPRLVARPGGYTTAVRSADRPRNVTEMAERADPEDRAPWPRGTSVPVGTRGKVAHWTGGGWKGGESPGYPEVTGAEAEVSATAPVSPRHAAPRTVEAPAVPPVPWNTQFPGDEQSGDLTR